MHPLDGPFLKIGRAEKQLQGLRDQELSFWGGKYYRVIPAEVDEKTGEQIFRILIEAYPSLDWGICIGEIAHNLRSALDGLIWQLALLNTDAPAKITQFPGGEDPIRPWNAAEKRRIASLRPAHQEKIHAFQPSNNGGTANPIYQLQQINNADKHRLIQVVGSRLGGVTTWAWGGDAESETFFHESQWDMSEMLEDGAIVGRGPITEAEMDPQITPSISFWRGCPALQRKRVTLVLDTICKEVSRIVESFRPDF